VRRITTLIIIKKEVIFSAFHLGWQAGRQEEERRDEASALKQTILDASGFE
jgi:hypothetical protein